MMEEILGLWDERQHFNQRRWGKDVEIEKATKGSIQSSRKMLSKVFLYSFYCALKSNLGVENLALNSRYFLAIARKSQTTYRTKGKTFWGDEMSLVYPEFASLSILRHGYYEEGLTRMVLEYLKPNMIFCDIGAHFGYYSLLASRIVGENGQVHSFEPTPSTFRLLHENTRGRSNITTNNCALYSKETTILLADHGPLYSGLNSVATSRCSPRVLKDLAPREIDVPAITFDQYVRSKGIQPDFVKIDVESAEYEVLLGMAETLDNIRPTISLEVGDIDLVGVKSSRELVSYLLERRYDAYEYDGSRIVKHKLRERYKSDNLLFVPR